jgi:hypothetical protein
MSDLSKIFEHMPLNRSVVKSRKCAKLLSLKVLQIEIHFFRGIPKSEIYIGETNIDQCLYSENSHASKSSNTINFKEQFNYLSVKLLESKMLASSTFRLSCVNFILETVLAQRKLYYQTTEISN